MGELFLKILGNQESGYSGDIPNQRGKYILIPRLCIDYFPYLSELRLNDFCVLRIDVPGPLQVGVRYHWHNAKYHPGPDHTRDHDERRIYRNRYFDEALDLDRYVIVGLYRKTDYEYVGVSALPTDPEYASLAALIGESSLSSTSNTSIIDLKEIPPVAPRFHARLLSTDLAEIAAGEDSQALINEDELLEDSLPLITPLAADEDPLSQLSSMFSGQVEFTRAVREIYGAKCAVRRSGLIGGSTIGLEAAHVKARAEGGPYLPTNGILLSADIHQAFDFGYWTLTNDLRIEVHENARIGELGRFHGGELTVPMNRVLRPFNAYIDWHRARVFGRFMAV